MRASEITVTSTGLGHGNRKITISPKNQIADFLPELASLGVSHVTIEWTGPFLDKFTVCTNEGRTYHLSYESVEDEEIPVVKEHTQYLGR